MEEVYKKEKPKIVIVGAGLAGLTCAYRLYKAGISCKIFEASERVGGRCFSIRDYFADNQIAEHGGEVIESEQTDIIELVKEMGLKLDNLSLGHIKGTKPFFYFNGQQYPSEEAIKDFQNVYTKAKRDYDDVGYPTLHNDYSKRAYELDNMSVRQWINSSVEGGINSNFGRLLDVAYNIEYGSETYNQSALNIVNLLGKGKQDKIDLFGKCNDKYHIRGGNDQLTWRLYRMLPRGTVKFKTQLISIAKVKYDKYKLIFQSEAKVASVMADIVILAIPFSTLRLMVNYEKAGFSKLKDITIEELGIATNSKLNIQFNKRYWRKSGCNGSTFGNIGYQSTWEATSGQGGTCGILVDYTGGKIGASFNRQQAVNQYKETFINRLDRVIPRYDAKCNGKVVLDYWTGYPWALGSYPYYKVGQYTKFAGIEGQREGNCFFAGDQTSINYQGCMNGAVESGERVSKEIINKVKE